MNIKRLLKIALEADKIGDYVTADRVTNLLKTAQGGAYSVYPNQAAYARTPQQSQQMLAAQQNQNKPATQQMPAMPQMNQEMPPQSGVYYAPVAPNVTYFTPGVVNVPKQNQMTEEQKAFAKLRGLRGQIQQADQVVKQQSMQPRQYPIYQTYQQPVYQGTNTQNRYILRPNSPTNMNLYGTGYASRALMPQQPNQQQQQQPYNQQPNQQPNQEQQPYNSQQPNQ